MHNPIWLYINTIIFGILAIETAVLSCLYGVQIWQSIRDGFFKKVWWGPLLLISHMFMSVIATWVFFIGLSMW